LIGPNGAGKTTLFNVLSRFQDADEGELYYEDRPIRRMKPHEMVAVGMARTFQNINLFREQSTLDNILIGAHRLIAIHSVTSTRYPCPAARARVGQTGNRNRTHAESGHELDNAAKNLPYGYQKRVELARALASRPKIILLDEPVAGCNDEETADLRKVVQRINRELGVTILMVEHDMSMVMSVCDYIYVINFGANLADGTPAQIVPTPTSSAPILGRR